jgi:outer membrane protein OmpA-like peptidoglycan-associated protein
MGKHGIRILVILFVIGIACASLGAQDIGEILGLRFKNRIISGEKDPAIVLTPQKAIKSIIFDCTRQDGKKMALSASNLKAGQTKELPFKQEDGQFTYAAEVTVQFKDGTEDSFAVDFDITVVGPLKIMMSEGDVDLETHTLQFQLSRAPSKAEIKVYDDTGSVIAENTANYEGEPMQDRWKIHWQQGSQKVAKIVLKATDMDGFWTFMEVSLWSIEIPHEEVNFEFGSATIGPSEMPKLDISLKLVEEALAKYGQAGLQAQLYIAGYTDTVGSNESNLNLSERRAKSIAQYFRQKGLKIAVYYQGFGEEVLAVKTDDNVPNDKNRRAIYILSNYPPPKSGAIPRGNWKPL